MVSPKCHTGGCKRSEEENSTEAEGSHASPIWVSPVLTGSAQHRADLGMGTTPNE